MAFLSTYRDIDIVDQLFRETMTGALKPVPQSIDEMRQTLIKHFVRLRVVKITAPTSAQVTRSSRSGSSIC